MDMDTFYDDGATENGTTITFNQSSPSGGMVDVTAAVSGAVPIKLFVLMEVNQHP